jgi:tRNA pseudouridine55 synthase
VHGVLVLDKPAGVSSATAVERVKHELRIKRAGHAGTLDPIATGVLAICIGDATKLAGYLIADDKAYEADALLGRETDTLDRTGKVTAESDVTVTRDQVLAALAARTGEQDQIPPMFSAIKQGGVRLYHKARAGEDVEREPRRVRIDRLELLAFEPPRLRLFIACSKGTYVRSIVADVGHDLGCGAHLTELRRTRSGSFTLDHAQQLGQLDASRLVPLNRALHLPVITVPAALLPKVLSGVQLPLEMLGAEPAQFQLVDEHGALVAIAHGDAGRVIYDRVFAP